MSQPVQIAWRVTARLPVHNDINLYEFYSKKLKAKVSLPLFEILSLLNSGYWYPSILNSLSGKPESSFIIYTHKMSTGGFIKISL